MRGLHVVVTAGGTEEPIDPIRVITNRSSGKMGFAVARAALDRGASVTLISSRGNGGLKRALLVPMTTVDSLRSAVLAHTRRAHVLVMAAAVTDFRCVSPAAQKIKKSSRISLDFEPVDDFTHEVSRDVFKIGFAAETENLIEHGRLKFVSHTFDLVCANDVTRPDAGFGAETNRVTLLEPTGAPVALDLMPKLRVAHAIWNHALPLMQTRQR